MAQDGATLYGDKPGSAQHRPDRNGDGADHYSVPSEPVPFQPEGEQNGRNAGPVHDTNGSGPGVNRWSARVCSGAEFVRGVISALTTPLRINIIIVAGLSYHLASIDQEIRLMVAGGLIGVAGSLAAAETISKGRKKDK